MSLAIWNDIIELCYEDPPTSIQSAELTYVEVSGYLTQEELDFLIKY